MFKYVGENDSQNHGYLEDPVYFLLVKAGICLPMSDDNPGEENSKTYSLFHETFKEGLVSKLSRLNISEGIRQAPFPKPLLKQLKNEPEQVKKVVENKLKSLYQKEMNEQ